MSLWNAKCEFNHDDTEYLQTLYQTFKVLQEYVLSCSWGKRTIEKWPGVIRFTSPITHLHVAKNVRDEVLGQLTDLLLQNLV